MNWCDMEKHFSTARLGRYRAARNGDVAKAVTDYARNVRLSEAMLPSLNVLEISLRNGIHARLSQRYDRADWWKAWEDDDVFGWQNKEVGNAKKKLVRRCERQTVDKVLAELPFGFWVSLFNSRFQSDLWKDLRLVFACCPRRDRQRQTISTALNLARDLRNRVFHHEPVLWLRPALIEQHAISITVINWVDPKLGEWLGRYDRLPTMWAQWVAEQ